MPSDLTGAEIDAIQDRFATDGDPTHDDVWTLIDYARSVPARIASARQEGYREGVEAARQVALHWLASLETDRDRATSALAHAEAAQMNQRVCGIAIVITAISALSPAPAEPSAPVAPDWPTRCAALEADGIAARKRVAALEAENTKLRAALGSYPNPSKYCGMHGFEEQRFFADYDTFRSRARALLQGGPDAG